ncbi:MAG: NMD3-related protein [Nanoarchaeota archaeon]
MKFARTDYYQGILQLRDINSEILDFVNRQIKERGNVAVTKVVKHANGFDMYLTSQKFILILGKKLKENFGGEIKISSRFHTRNKQGKDLYRVNVLFRLLKFKTGDVVFVREDKLKLIRIGKKIFARNMKTGKRVTVRSRDLIN